LVATRCATNAFSMGDPSEEINLPKIKVNQRLSSV